MKSLFGEGITFRHWLAWQLQKLAWYINYIHNGDRQETITIYKDDQVVAKWEITGDIWGKGVHAQTTSPKFRNKYRIEVNHGE